MNNMYVSPATLASLEKEFHIYWSPVRLILYTVLFVGFTFLCLFGGFVMVSNHGWSTGPLLAFGGAALFSWLSYRLVLVPLGQWGKPVVTLSAEGITFIKKPLLPWSQIVSNDWNQTRVNGVRSNVSVILKTTDGKKTVFNGTLLKIKGSEYLRLCDLYRYSSSQTRTEA